MQAVILAAGMGTRLPGRDGAPKGALRIGERSIIEESLDALRAAGIISVVVVTGHGAGFYEGLVATRSGLRTVLNERYATTGSLRSLLCARAAVEGPCVVLESDLVYEPRALRALLECGHPDAVLLSGPTGGGDEVHVEARDGWLCGMAKDRSRLGAIAGEFVGMSRLSLAGFAALEAAARRLPTGDDADYEAGLVEMAIDRCVACVLVEDLLWCEIDDPAQLARAASVVHPRVRAMTGDATGGSTS